MTLGMLGPVAILTVMIVTAPLTAAAQQPAGKVHRIGSLSPDAHASARDEALKQGLRELGWIEGQNITIEYRWAADRTERLPALAEELVRLKVDVIVAWTTRAVREAKNATRAIPIVMLAADPMTAGLITNLARPGGNITGVSLMAPELAGKRLELLREIVPGLSRVAFLAHGGDPIYKTFVKEIQGAGQRIGVRVQPLVVTGPEEFVAAFAAMTKERAGALVVQPFFTTVAGYGSRLAELAVRHRLPTISDGDRFAELGGLVYYGADRLALHRRVATYVDKILRGAKPADLPVEQPTKFELVVNLKTAKALGLTIPQSILLRADKVLE